MENVCGTMYKCMYVVKEMEKRNKSMERIFVWEAISLGPELYRKQCKMLSLLLQRILRNLITREANGSELWSEYNVTVGNRLFIPEFHEKGESGPSECHVKD